MKREEIPPRFRLPSCATCGAAGTIVELGVCCRVRELDARSPSGDFRDTEADRRRKGLPPRRSA